MESGQKIRRLESRLYTCGVGMILFSIWSAIRDMEIFYRILKELPPFEDEILTRKVVCAVLGVIVCVTILLTACIPIYIGRKAMLTSRRKYSKNTFLVLAVLSLCVSLGFSCTDLVNFFKNSSFHIELVIVYIINLTSTIILAEVIVFAILLKRARKQICR